MFYVEYEKNTFIDAEEINYLHIHKDEIVFTIKSDSENIFSAQGYYAPVFINNIQALNTGLINVENRFNKFGKE